jgi:hypothetical protein
MAGDAVFFEVALVVVFGGIEPLGGDDFGDDCAAVFAAGVFAGF